jgi:hypothetical protein
MQLSGSPVGHYFCTRTLIKYRLVNRKTAAKKQSSLLPSVPVGSVIAFTLSNVNLLQKWKQVENEFQDTFKNNPFV